jgi:hypothetical protein
MEPNPYEAPQEDQSSLSWAEWLRFWIPRISIAFALAGVVAMASGFAYVLYAYAQFAREF